MSYYMRLQSYLLFFIISDIVVLKEKPSAPHVRPEGYEQGKGEHSSTAAHHIFEQYGLLAAVEQECSGRQQAAGSATAIQHFIASGPVLYLEDDADEHSGMHDPRGYGQQNIADWRVLIAGAFKNVP